MAIQNYASKGPEEIRSLESGTRILYNEIGAVSKKMIAGIAAAAILIGVPLTLYVSKGSRDFVYRNVPWVRSTVDTYYATKKIPAQLGEILNNTEILKKQLGELSARVEECACPQKKPVVKPDYKKSQEKKYKPAPKPVPRRAELPPHNLKKPEYTPKLPEMTYTPAPPPSGDLQYAPKQPPTPPPSAYQQPPLQPFSPPEPAGPPKKTDTEKPKIEARMPEQPKTLCNRCTFEPGRDLSGKELEEGEFYKQFKDKIAR